VIAQIHKQKEVIIMTEQKGSCGCGCVPMHKMEQKDSCGCGCVPSEQKDTKAEDTDRTKKDDKKKS
jgi:hypothetical protein